MQTPQIKPKFRNINIFMTLSAHLQQPAKLKLRTCISFYIFFLIPKSLSPDLEKVQYSWFLRQLSFFYLPYFASNKKQFRAH